jgi:tyrosinase
MLEWTVRIRCNTQELSGSFSVLVFLGRVPDDPKKWARSPSCVGIHDVFASSCPPDSPSEADAEVEGYVALNEGLLKYSGLSELIPDVVVPYLKSELHWRVQDVSYIYILKSSS